MVAGKHNAPTCVAFLRFLFSATLKGKKKALGMYAIPNYIIIFAAVKGKRPLHIEIIVFY